MIDSRIHDAASLLVQARQTGRWLPCLPESCRPASVDEAYAIQAAVAEALGARAIGWKVAVNATHGPVAAPLFAVLASGERYPHRDGLGVETELGVRLGADLPRRARPYSRGEVVDAIAAVSPCFEIVESRYQDQPAPSFLEFLADGLANAAAVRGAAERAATGLAIERLGVVLSQDDAEIWNAAGRHAAGDPLAPLVAYANAGGDRLGGLRKGQLVITGTLTGLIKAPPARRFAAAIEAVGPVAVSFTA